MYKEFMPNWAKEEACFANEKLDNGERYPRIKPQDQKAYEEWKADVINPLTQEYYSFTMPDGTKREAHYEINTIIRQRQYDDTEKLVTIGNLVGYTALGDERICQIRKPEMWRKTEFNHTTAVDSSNTNRLTTRTVGPKPAVDVYELEWNEQNLKTLLDQVRDKHISLVVKEQSSQRAVSVKPQATWSKTIELFKNNTFDYLIQGLYIDAEERKMMRELAKKEGLIEAEPTRSR